MFSICEMILGFTDSKIRSTSIQCRVLWRACWLYRRKVPQWQSRFYLRVRLSVWQWFGYWWRADSFWRRGKITNEEYTEDKFIECRWAKGKCIIRSLFRLFHALTEVLGSADEWCDTCTPRYTVWGHRRTGSHPSYRDSRCRIFHVRAVLTYEWRRELNKTNSYYYLGSTHLYSIS